MKHAFDAIRIPTYTLSYQNVRVSRLAFENISNNCPTNIYLEYGKSPSYIVVLHTIHVQ